jgi:hypothetical protein
LLCFFMLTGEREKDVQYARWKNINFVTKRFLIEESLPAGYTPKDREEASIPVPIICSISYGPDGSAIRFGIHFRNEGRKTERTHAADDKARRSPRRFELRLLVSVGRLCGWCQEPPPPPGAPPAPIQAASLPDRQFLRRQAPHRALRHSHFRAAAGITGRMATQTGLPLTALFWLYFLLSSGGPRWHGKTGFSSQTCISDLKRRRL